MARTMLKVIKPNKIGSVGQPVDDSEFLLPDYSKVRATLPNGKEYDIYAKGETFEIREVSGNTLSINVQSSNCIQIF